MAAGMQFFVDGNDVPLLLARLNDDPELAFIVERGSGSVAGSGARWARYQLADRVDALPDGQHRLWHVAGHSLSEQRDGLTSGSDPRAGWVVTSDGTPGMASLAPTPGSSVIHLSVWSRHLPYSAEELRSTIPVSFWLERREWWGRFQRWMRSNTTPLRVHRQVTFHAFPSALQRLRSGIAYYSSGWDLGPALSELSQS